MRWVVAAAIVGVAAGCGGTAAHAPQPRPPEVRALGTETASILRDRLVEGAKDYVPCWRKELAKRLAAESAPPLDVTALAAADARVDSIDGVVAHAQALLGAMTACRVEDALDDRVAEAERRLAARLGRRLAVARATIDRLRLDLPRGATPLQRLDAHSDDIGEEHGR